MLLDVPSTRSLVCKIRYALVIEKMTISLCSGHHYWTTPSSTQAPISQAYCYSGLQCRQRTSGSGVEQMLKRLFVLQLDLTSSNQRLWSSGYDSRLGFYKNQLREVPGSSPGKTRFFALFVFIISIFLVVLC